MTELLLNIYIILHNFFKFHFVTRRKVKIRIIIFFPSVYMQNSKIFSISKTWILFEFWPWNIFFWYAAIAWFLKMRLKLYSSSEMKLLVWQRKKGRRKIKTEMMANILGTLSERVRSELKYGRRGRNRKKNLWMSFIIQSSRMHRVSWESHLTAINIFNM